MTRAILEGTTILITGAAGQVAFPIARALAKRNRVYGLARFTKAADRSRLEGLGVRCIQADLADGNLSQVPDDVEYVLNFAYVSTGNFDYDLAANAESVGRLMARCQRARAWLQCSTLGVYAYAARRPLREGDALGDDHRGFLTPTYSLTKIAAEAMVRFGSRQWNVPATIARLGVAYGDNGGWPAMHLESLRSGSPILVHPDRPNLFSPIHEDDYVNHVHGLLSAAAVPPTLTNWGGSEPVSLETWCSYMAELIGVTPQFQCSDNALASIVLDPTRMHALVGLTTVPWRDGIRRMVRVRHPELPLRE